MGEPHTHNWTAWHPLGVVAGVQWRRRICPGCASTEDQPVTPDPADGRCPVMIQCHRETGHDDPRNPPAARRHEAAEESP